MQPLEQYLGFAFTQDMLSARFADRLVWIQTTRGVRNIFSATGPDYTPVQLTSWRDDDGQLLSELQLADDGSIIIVIRGENKSELGDYPNPCSQVEPPKQALWFIDLSQTESLAVELAETDLACLRPNTREVYFVKKNKLYSLDTSAEPADPELIITTRGKITELSWSEQGDRLALVISRNKHGFIGIFSPGESQLQWLDPSFDRDCQPVWSPDGKKLAFLRCHGCKPDIAHLWFSNFSDAFELRVADVAALTSKPHWVCPKDHGISFQEGRRPILWINDDELIFSHEASGFDHIYRVDIHKGGKKNAVKSLTSGDFLVHSYSLARDSEWLYFTHNQNNPHGFHLARLHLKSLEQQDLQTCLPEQSSSFFPAALQNDQVGFVITGTEHPLTPAILNPETGGLNHFAQSGYAQVSQQFVAVEKVTLKAPDGLELHCQLFKPHDPGPLPALLTFHGGPWCQTLAGFGVLRGLSYVYAACQFLASQGFVVLSLNYRGSSGYGKAFRQPGPYFFNGACEYQDVLTAGYWLAEDSDVDADRIGVWGKSYGGYLTAMSLARNSNLFKAGVDIEGCHNIPREMRQKHWGSTLFIPEAGETLEEVQERSQIALESSPWHFLDSWTSPVLLVHPDDDRNVQFEESQTLYHELRKRKVDVEALVIPDEVHSFLCHQPWLKAYNKLVDFFRRKL